MEISQLQQWLGEYVKNSQYTTDEVSRLIAFLVDKCHETSTVCKDINNTPERYLKTDRLLNLFPNGVLLYNTNATFNKVIQMMLRGTTPHEIIESLIEMADHSNKALEDHLVRGK